jgi:23S rRNA (guanosine2251-2'-O)-methyltransferase
VEGRRAVIELLAGARSVLRVLLCDGLEPSPQLDRIEELSVRRKVRVETLARARFDALALTESSQGVIALARPIKAVDLADLTEPVGGAPAFLLVVAGVTDPRNLGAVLRSAECAGVHGVVLPRHRAARLTPTVTKVAAGAAEHLRFALVGGIPTALEQLRGRGVWSLGLAPDAPHSIYDITVADAPVALVVGAEETGLAPLARQRCDEVVRIPQLGSVASLNVGVAAAVACFEIARQRAAGGRRS